MKEIDRKLINDLPICDNGKETVTKLIEGLGFKVTKPKPLISGRIYQCPSTDAIYQAVCTDIGTTIAVYFNGVVDRGDLLTWHANTDHKEIAVNWEDYFKKKFAGEVP